MADLCGGSVLGAVVGELLKAVLDATKKAINFKSILDRLKRTLHTVRPVFDEIERLNKVLDRPKDETDSFINQLKKAQKLINKCSKVKYWNVYKRFVYSKKLLDLDSSLLRFFQVDVQIQLSRDNRKILVGMEKLLSIHVGHGAFDMASFPGPCGIPEVPEFIVAFDQPLEELKMMLLKDDLRVVGLSAPGGCGKTTLAKMLCRHHEIKAIYRDNIFFVNAAKTPTLEVIVQRIFQHIYHQAPCFQSDEDAINQLECTLRELEPPILLVLDDVWSSSESLVRKFMFRIPKYKILVTSRSDFPSFDYLYKLNPLNDQDAMILFCHSAFPYERISDVPVDLVKEVMKGCGGFPLALTVVGKSLYIQPEVIWRNTLKKWSEGKSIFDSNSELLLSLKTSLDSLDDAIVRDCFLDLGAFPEDQKISVEALMDMWVELYNLDEDGMDTLCNLLQLSSRNLVNLVLMRKDVGEVDCYCKEHFVTQHDLLRDLAIHQSSLEPIEKRRRLIVEIHGNNIPKWWIEQRQQPMTARLLSITTDETFSSSWYDMELLEIEALILNIQTKNYTLPQFMEKIDNLKLLTVTNYGFHLADLYNFQMLGCLSNLKRIRLEHISISSLGTTILQLRSLQKLSLVMCEIGEAFENCTLENPQMLPNLVEIDINCCEDLVTFPEGLCNMVHLKRLSISYCQELSTLPVGLGNLTNLEVLRLHSCTKLGELPESVGNLKNLRLLDITDCLGLGSLPINMDELCALRTLYMRGCHGLFELPESVMNLGQLKYVVSDEEIACLWEPYKRYLTNLNISVIKEDANLNWLHNLGS